MATDNVARGMAGSALGRVDSIRSSLSLGTCGFGAHGGLLTNNYSVNLTEGDTTTYRMHARTPPHGVAGFRVAFANWRMAGGGDTDGANSITVKAALEINSNFYPLFFNGSRTLTLEAGAEVLSDFVGVEAAAGTDIWIRTRPTATGGVWPLGRLIYGPNAAGEGWAGKDGADLVDATGFTGLSSGSSKYAFGPSAVLAFAQYNDAPSVLVIGDSIAAGLLDTADANNFQGYIERALSTTVAWQTLTKAGIGAYAFVVGKHDRAFAHRADACTHVLCELGINDFNGLSVSSAKARFISLWNALGLYRGKRVYQTTITPYTTSTDSWATVGNQTVIAGIETTRTTFNDWVRAGAPISAGVGVAPGTAGALVAGNVGHPLKGYLEVADICESARNSGLWKASYTTDGLHPKTAIHDLMKVPVAAWAAQVAAGTA